MSRDESRRSKRSRADRNFELGSAAGIMANDYDDERTLDEEEALEAGEDTRNELSNLQKESDMPLKELLVMYGYGDMACQDSNKVDDEDDDEDDEDEDEEDDEDEDDDYPGSYEPDLKQFYTEMVKGEENGPSSKQASVTKSDLARTGEATSPTTNINALSTTSGESKIEDSAGLPENASSDNPILSGAANVGSGIENANSDLPEGGTIDAGCIVGSGGGGGSSRLLRSVSRPQSEEEEDDCDYSPDEEEWKKTIMVGSDYQAPIPEGLCKYDDALPYENEDKMLWDPSHISEEEAEEFLERAQLPVVKGTSLPSGNHVRDDEQALYLLLQCGYNLEEALRRRRMNVLPPTESVSLWSEEECHNFETGLRNYGKDFHLIQKNKVRTRSVGELVQFYYLWKKTERHDIFTYKARLEKKKYALHPGITDYMDRFLEEQEGVRDRSSSPNVHCLLYGDTKRQRTSTNSMNNEDAGSGGKAALENWEGSGAATTSGATTQTTNSSGGADNMTSTPVNSGPVDPLALDHHRNLSSPVTGAGQLDYSKANATVESSASGAAAISWSSASMIPTSSSLSSVSQSMSQQQQHQQRNHLHPRHLQQMPSTNSHQHSNNPSAMVVHNSNITEEAAVAAAVAAARSPENILPHLPP